jgi:hypothetical protein
MATDFMPSLQDYNGWSPYARYVRDSSPAVVAIVGSSGWWPRLEREWAGVKLEARGQRPDGEDSPNADRPDGVDDDEVVAGIPPIGHAGLAATSRYESSGCFWARVHRVLLPKRPAATQSERSTPARRQ